MKRERTRIAVLRVVTNGEYCSERCRHSVFKHWCRLFYRALTFDDLFAGGGGQARRAAA
jgi:hypothetical protein